MPVGLYCLAMPSGASRAVAYHAQMSSGNGPSQLQQFLKKSRELAIEFQQEADEKQRKNPTGCSCQHLNLLQKIVVAAFLPDSYPSRSLSIEDPSWRPNDITYPSHLIAAGEISVMPTLDQAFP